MGTLRVNTTFSSNGQVVIPKEVRQTHGWAPGTVLVIEEQGDGILLRAAPASPRTPIDDVLGCLPHAAGAKFVSPLHPDGSRSAPLARA